MWADCYTLAFPSDCHSMGCIYRIQIERVHSTLGDGRIKTDLAKPISSVKLREQKIWPCKNPWSCGPEVIAVMPALRSCRGQCGLFLLSLALGLPLCLASAAPELGYIPATNFAFTSAANTRLHCTVLKYIEQRFFLWERCI